MKIRLSLSSKQVGRLYHKTTKRALLNILRTGKLALSTGRGMLVEHKHQSGRNFFASFTRSRFGGYHFHEGGTTSIHEDTIVMLTVDGDGLSNREKFVQLDYWEQRGNPDPSVQRNKEYEERLVSNKAEVPILRYIKRVDFIQRSVHGNVETYGFDKGKFKRQENDRHQRMLGSIILQLKKNKIPFAFYDNMNDWAKKRGEYTYVGPKDVDVGGGRTGYQSSRSYKSMQALIEALSDKPYAELSEDAQQICSQLSRYPTDVDAVFNDYENFRKPDASPPMRTLALKLARVMQRSGFNTKVEAGKFLAEKANVHYKQKQEREIRERNIKLAPLFVEALLKPRSEWSDNPSYYSPKRLFDISDRFSYTYDESVRFMREFLKSDAPEIDKVRAAMKELKLNDADDYVSYIYYEKIKKSA